MKSIQGGERNHQREILIDKDAISPDMRISALVFGSSWNAAQLGM